MAGLDPSGRELDQLLTRCLAGDATACEQFDTQLNALAQPAIRALRLRPHEPDEVLQRTRVRVRDAFEGGRLENRSNGAIAAYIQTTARRQGLNLIRDRNRRENNVEQPGSPDDSDPLDKAAAPGPNPEDHARVTEMLKMVKAWAPVDQLILLGKFHGQTTAEIRRQLCEPPYNVRADDRERATALFMEVRNLNNTLVRTLPTLLAEVSRLRRLKQDERREGKSTKEGSE
jgi:DNA-directed RNA polymerase specialized sigma24 family protein